MFSLTYLASITSYGNDIEEVYKTQAPGRALYDNLCGSRGNEENRAIDMTKRECLSFVTRIFERKLMGTPSGIHAYDVD